MADLISLEESVVTAMDGTDKELFPFLPYILQDTWEIGAEPITIIKLIYKYANNFSNLNLLDLGCGKGAVSVMAAHKLNCRCHGIDAIPEFIDEARQKAIEYHVDHLCNFEVDDIRIRTKTLARYDIIILGAIGPVLGDCLSTLTSLLKNLNADGIIIIDDGYIENNSTFTHPLIDEVIMAKDEIKDSDNNIYANLEKRCLELMELHPDKQNLFQSYICKQVEANDVLENKVVCSTMVIKKNNLLN